MMSEGVYKVYFACGNCGRPFICELKRGEKVRYNERYLAREFECPHCGYVAAADRGLHPHRQLDFESYDRLHKRWGGELSTGK